MQSDIGSLFQAGLQTGPNLAVELISSHVRIGGSVNLGAYTRLSDLLNFHDEILTVKDGVVLNRTGIATADGSPQLDVRLDGLTMVIDRSDYVPPPDSEAVEKRPFRFLAVTQGHVITGTFFIYPSAEPIAYLRAQEPHWVPIADIRVRSMVDRRIKFSAGFAVLNRRAVVATAVV
jgi:hypothetical protein